MSSSNKLSSVNFYEKITSINDEVSGLKYVIDSKLIPNELPKDCINDDYSGLMVLRKVKFEKISY